MIPKFIAINLKLYTSLIGLLAVVIISILDYFIVIDISLSILYLLPISLTRFSHKKGDR